MNKTQKSVGQTFKNLNVITVEFLDIWHVIDYLVISLQGSSKVENLDKIVPLKNKLIKEINSSINRSKYDSSYLSKYYSKVLTFLEQLKPKKVERDIVGSTDGEIINILVIAGAGVVLVTNLNKGSICVEDSIEIIGVNKRKLTHVKKIEKNNKFINVAHAGDKVGILVSGSKEEYEFAMNGGYLIKS